MKHSPEHCAEVLAEHIRELRQLYARAQANKVEVLLTALAGYGVPLAAEALQEIENSSK